MHQVRQVKEARLSSMLPVPVIRHDAEGWALSWHVFGIRSASDDKIVFVAHAKDIKAWKVRKGRNKTLDVWLSKNSDHERVPLAKAKDRQTAMKLTAELVRKTKPELQRKRGTKAGRRHNSAAKPRTAEVPTEPPTTEISLRKCCSLKAMERALAAAKWTLEEETNLLLTIARDPGHAKQLEAINLLQRRRKEALEHDDEEPEDDELNYAAMKHGGLNVEGKDHTPGRDGDEADSPGAAAGGERPSGRSTRGDGDGDGEEHSSGEGGDGPEFGWHKPDVVVPGTGGGLSR